MSRGRRGRWAGLASAAPLIVLCSSGAPKAMLQQAPTFRATTEMVRLEVLVTTGGVATKGLTVADFEVRDNGIPQKVRLLSDGRLPVSLVLVLDVSESVEGERLSHLVNGSTALLDALGPDDSLTLLTFNHTIALQARQVRGEQGRRQLRLLAGTGMTALRDAAYAGILTAENQPGRSLAVIFSDGYDTSSWLTGDQVLASARRADVLTYGVVLDQRSPSFLENLSSETGGTVFHANAPALLKATFLRVLDDFRSRYLIGYVPSGVEDRGWHRLDVRIKGRHAEVKTRPGYVR